MTISRRMLRKAGASAAVMADQAANAPASIPVPAQTAKPKDLIPRGHPTPEDIAEWIDRARLGAPFDTISTHAPHAMGRALRIAALARFVRQHVEQHGHLPTGHKTIVATYGPPGTDLVTPWSGTLRTLSVTADFPARSPPDASASPPQGPDPQGVPQLPHHRLRAALREVPGVEDQRVGLPIDDAAGPVRA